MQWRAAESGWQIDISGQRGGPKKWLLTQQRAEGSGWITDRIVKVKGRTGPGY